MTRYAIRQPLDDVIDLSQDVDEDDELNVRICTFHIAPEDVEETLDDADHIRELNEDEIRDLQARLQKSSTDSPIPLGYEAFHFATTQTEAFVRPDVGVELQDGDFLYVMHVYRHRVFEHDIVVKGILLRRTRRVEGYFKKNRNELCAILRDVENVKDPALNSYMVCRPLAAIVQVRNIIFTNKDFPLLSFRHSGKFYPHGKDGEAMIEETADLVCRHKYVEYCCLANGKVLSGAIMRLRESEASPGKATSDVGKKLTYREENTPSMSTPKKARSCKNSNTVDLTSDDDSNNSVPIKKRSSKDTIDLTQDEVEEQRETHHISKVYRRSIDEGSIVEQRIFQTQKLLHRRRSFAKTPASSQNLYVYGDVCAGAGGMTRGADDAGFLIDFVLDRWKPATNTLSLNWARGGTRILHTDIFEFCTRAQYAKGYKVDVLHVSFPCQVYSGAHTCEGKNDTANEAAGYSVLPLLERCKPRVLSMEQTSGLLERHPSSFRAMIHQLTAAGYSCRWKIWNCSELENVQARKRLFIIASCPGEPLSPFPKPTHGIGRGLKPFTTITDRLRLMPRYIDPHMRAFTPKNAEPYNPNSELKNCITTCGGVSDLHFSGQRSHNMQELALLAGFPPYHKFAPDNMTNIRRQIGNAVPSIVAKKIFAEIKTSMEAEDLVVAAYKPEIIKLD